MTAYAPPVDLETFYDEVTLNYLYRIMAGRPWAIHLIGPDEIHYNEDFEKPEDDPANPELTQRTALKVATELNAFVATQVRPDEDPPLMYHAVVFHYGEPWVAPEADYCEYFDFDSFDWFCNQCFAVLKATGAHCPTCAPTHFPGLMRVPCDAEPNEHPALFMYADNTDGYSGAWCQFCIAKHQREADAEDARRAHAKHRAWRRWGFTRRVLDLGKRLRLVDGYSWSYSAICNGCVGITWRWER